MFIDILAGFLIILPFCIQTMTNKEKKKELICCLAVNWITYIFIDYWWTSDGISPNKEQKESTHRAFSHSHFCNKHDVFPVWERETQRCFHRAPGCDGVLNIQMRNVVDDTWDELYKLSEKWKLEHSKPLQEGSVTTSMSMLVTVMPKVDLAMERRHSCSCVHSGMVDCILLD